MSKESLNREITFNHSMVRVNFHLSFDSVTFGIHYGLKPRRATTLDAVTKCYTLCEHFHYLLRNTIERTSTYYLISKRLNSLSFIRSDNVCQTEIKSKRPQVGFRSSVQTTLRLPKYVIGAVKKSLSAAEFFLF